MPVPPARLRADRLEDRTAPATGFAVGRDAGGPPTVIRYDPTGAPAQQFDAFGSTFGGGVRVASADFSRDGVPDVVVGNGPGVAAQVFVIDGVTQAPLFSNAPFELGFTGGVYVAAGDLTGDGVPEVVISPDQGGGPRVRVFDGANRFAQIIDFFGIEDPAFRGGARTAVGDVNGDGVGDLVVAAGFLGGPRVTGYDGKTLATGQPVRVFADFFAFEQSLRNGVFVAAGDLDGDGKAEVIAGGGPSGGPRVTAFSGADLLSNRRTAVANFFAGDPNNRGGIRLAVANLDDDTRADLVTGSGTAAGTRVTAYFGVSLTPTATPEAAFAFDAFEGSTNGVFVG
jgi:hypothetical protein